MKPVYCISGFGADERVFSKLNFNGYDVHFIPWIIPQEKENIASYAARMSESIKDKNPVLLGLSFGGIMCIEIAKIINTSQVIIISGIKTRHELPFWMKFAGIFKLDKVFPLRTFRFIEPLENHNLGIETAEELNLVRYYRNTINQQYTNWATHQIINWKNDWIPERLYHIHGGMDHIFPARNIKADYVIPDGGHFMIMNRAEKINGIIQGLLK